jgi:type III restriction enzyme
VVASESYDTFAKELQKEILDSLSGRAVTLSVEVLDGRVLKNSEGEKFEFNSTSAMDLVFDFKMK